jgi:hypothetical protein
MEGLPQVDFSFLQGGYHLALLATMVTAPKRKK